MLVVFVASFVDILAVVVVDILGVVVVHVEEVFHATAPLILKSAALALKTGA